ncbi:MULTISPECIES: sugar ABC transporter permease [Streptomyces]|uniref:sugar ABC transporter permease n=1 Tax=Streptomyces TaxID=1883 RepID=UPI0004E6A751|nr:MULTISPECIES: ABC transporter permease [Streptomyces]KFG10328.1 ABC transporter permease [Streptomyces scabiei]MDW8474467.1 sugar ABC transporter permease [Streptomyces scabiei]MDX2573048.1 sugar ABC transporter permease [Streptomyces scabiei]MDX2578314.1 sugar ABC transporter permease [Streptomyces scabiei]MDX2632293.1 sugar ABC transporter permease [Streptomyces scabiei]
MAVRGSGREDGGETKDRQESGRRWYGDRPRAYARAVRHRVHAGGLGPVPALLALAVTWTVFQSLNENFLSPRNLSVLSVEIVGTGMVAVGVVFVLLIGELDLSVGSLAGLSGAMFAALNVNHGMPEGLAVLVAVGCGAAAGALHGFVFTRIGVPAFVVTLAGLLAWNGLMLYLLGPESSISFSDDGLVAELTTRSFGSPAVTYGLAALGPAAYLLLCRRDRRRRAAAGMPCRAKGEIWLRTALLAAVAFATVFVLDRFEGLPLALLIFLAVVVASDLLLRRTVYGRQVLALGSGVEAARRSGVDVSRVRISVFLISGTLAAVGGLFVASRLTSATQVPGSGMLLINAIAAAVIGGTSLFGGRGSTWSALLGVLIIQSIASGMALLGVQPAVQFMITGGVLLIAVVFDSLARRAAESRGRA